MTSESDPMPTDPTTPGPGRFVGRHAELAALARARSGIPAVVLIEGEAGIGKSRLLAEALAGRTDALFAACPPGLQRYTLAPVVEAVRLRRPPPGLSVLAGVLRALLPEWSEALPPAPAPTGDPHAAQHQVFRALGEVLTALAVDVLVIDDVHWADDATLEFLLFLTSRAQPLTLVLSYRPEDLPPDSLLLRLSARSAPHRVSLTALDVAGTAALVSSMLNDEPVSEAFASFLHQHTDGVPLAVEETVRLLHDRADLRRRSGRWVRHQLRQLQVPPTVRDAVAERVSRLGAPARQVLRAAAVLAGPADDAALAAVTALPAEAVAEGLAEAMACALLVDRRDGAVFRHGLAARAVYESVPAPVRRTLHQRAGRFLQERSPLAAIQLARHFREGGDVELWRRYAERAAVAAESVGDQSTALDLLHDLLTTADLPPADVLSVMRRVPRALLYGPERIAGLLAVLQTALTAAADPDVVGGLRYQRAMLHDLLDDHEASRAELAAVLPVAPADAPERVSALLLLGWARGTASTRAEHLAWLRRAEPVLEALPDPARLAARAQLATGLLLLGEPDGWAVADRIPEPAGTPTPGQISALILRDMNVGDMAMRWGRHDQARSRLTKALELADRHQFPRFRGTIVSTLIHLDWLEGRWSGLAARAEAFPEEIGTQPSDRREAMLVRAQIAAAQGGAAEADLTRVGDQWRRSGEVYQLAGPAAALARLRLDRGEPDAALADTEAPVRICRHKNVWLWATDVASVRVEALLALGCTDEAAELTAAYDRGLDGLDAPAPRAGLAVCRALLARAVGSPSSAAALFAEAAAAWDRIPRSFDAALAREQQGGCLLAAGDQDAAAAVLGRAWGELNTLGATVAATRVHAVLTELGAVPEPAPRAFRGGRRGYGSRLSPREVEVVRLVVSGRTNPQIAQALHRSPKTVANQINSAMRKLKVSSRTALAVAATRNDEVLAEAAEGAGPEAAAG